MTVLVHERRSSNGSWVALALIRSSLFTSDSRSLFFAKLAEAVVEAVHHSPRSLVNRWGILHPISMTFTIPLRPSMCSVADGRCEREAKKFNGCLSFQDLRH